MPNAPDQSAGSGSLSAATRCTGSPALPTWRGRSNRSHDRSELTGVKRPSRLRAPTSEFGLTVAYRQSKRPPADLAARRVDVGQHRSVLRGRSSGVQPIAEMLVAVPREAWITDQAAELVMVRPSDLARR